MDSERRKNGILFDFSQPLARNMDSSAALVAVIRTFWSLGTKIFRQSLIGTNTNSYANLY